MTQETKMAKTASKVSVERYAEDLKRAFAENKMTVFLCGPSMSTGNDASRLRERLRADLEAAEFEVVLGEDDGLEFLRKRFRMYAHQNELAFIEKECGAIVLIAASVGSYCELGLFAHVHTQNDSNRRDFVLIVEKKFEAAKSYLNEGPAKAISDFGAIFYDDFELFDCRKVVERLERRRALYVVDGRGRPTKATS